MNPPPPILGQPFKLSLAPTAPHPSAPDEATIATQEPKVSFPPRCVHLSSRTGHSSSRAMDRSLLHQGGRSGISPSGRTSSARQPSPPFGRALAWRDRLPQTWPMGPSQRKWAGSCWFQAALSTCIITLRACDNGWTHSCPTMAGHGRKRHTRTSSQARDPTTVKFSYIVSRSI